MPIGILDDITQLFTFPDEFPNVTTGILLHDKRVLITGHENGYLMKCNIDTGKHEKLFECGSTIETISESPAKDILVGCNSGLLFIFPLSSPKERTILQEPKFSKFSRVWRTAWSSENDLIMTSTYGGLYHYYKKNSEWENESLIGHSDSIFGVGNKNSRFLATGDYRGRILIWEFKDGTYYELDRLSVHGKVEAISWIRDDAFATIDEYGHINVIELDLETNQWKSVFEADAATSSGTTINITDDGKTIFAGSFTEVIQFDLDSQYIQTIDIKNTKAIFSKGNQIYILTKSGLLLFEYTAIKVPVNLVTYRYAKVSLIGHTGVGKSTLCNIIITGSNEKIGSTFGRKVWTWIVSQSDKNNPERRIIFHDHGGQKTVLQTFLPFLTDSDIILVLFRQIDLSTFEIARNLLDELKSMNNRAKFFLVQTHIDDKMNEIDTNQIELLKKSNNIIDCLKTSSETNEGIDNFKERLVQEISWQDAKTMIQSEYVTGLTKTITYLQHNNATVVSFNDFKKHYKEIAELEVPNHHLQFLLKNISNQGLIEYHSELNSIIFNDEDYSKLRTNIPILAQQKNGILSIKDIEESFGKSPYVYILDKVFLNSSLSIPYKDLRIFPNYLKKNGIKISESIKSLLEKSSIQKKLYFPSQTIDLTNLIKALMDLKLNCVDASTTQGIFTWQTNACVYYTISEINNELKGSQIQISYYIGGKKESTCTRLADEFLTIITRIFGSPLSNPT